MQNADNFVPSLVVAVIVALPTPTAVTKPSELTVAIASSSLCHVTVRSSTVSGDTIAVNCAVLVLSNANSVLFNEISSANFGETVTVQDTDNFVPSLVVAVIVVFPTPTAVTNPSELTVATFSSPLCHVTVRSSTVSGDTIAVSCAVSVLSNANSVLFSEISSANFGVTFTAHVAIFLELSLAVAVTVAVPAFKAFTQPSALTTTISSSLLVHVTVRSSAVSGSTVATNCTESVFSIVSSFLFNDIDSVNIGVTVTLHVANMPESSVAVAVIVASPTPIATTLPLTSTVAIFSALLVHLTR